MKNVYLITGSPAAGKSTYAKENAGKNDIIFDLDEVNKALDTLLPKDEPTVLITRWPCVLKKFSKQDLDRLGTHHGLKGALTERAAEDRIFVLENLDLSEVKTKKFVEVLKNLKIDEALLVVEEDNKNAVLSARNVEGVKTAYPNTINVYDILKYDSFVVTKAAVKTIEEVYA